MTAERQLWMEASRREKQRVEDLHKAAKAKGKTSTAQFSPARAAKPWAWTRTGPGPLFDLDDEFVSAVTDFDYDLNDPDFVLFLDSQLHICRAEGSTYWNLLQKKTVSYSEFVENPDMQQAQEFEGKRHQYSPAHLNRFWGIFLRTRVYLQGAYDCYRDRETTSPLISAELGVD